MHSVSDTCRRLIENIKYTNVQYLLHYILGELFCETANDYLVGIPALIYQ